MKKLKLFYLETCPYCINAQKALSELLTEHPSYESIEIEWIEESRDPFTAGRYDYYYVPAVFMGDQKLYEASPSHDYYAIREHLRDALNTAEG